MITNVTDSRSNANDQIAHAVNVLGRSDHRRRVFDAISKGKKVTKTVQELANVLGLTRKQVLNAARPLVANQLVAQTKVDGDTAYTKDSFFSAQRTRILRLVDEPSKLDELPTKTRPHTTTATRTITFRPEFVRTEVITIQALDQLAPASKLPPRQVIELPERAFKQGFQRIVGEQGDFADWGGEKNDLFTTNLKVHGFRKASAIAFKGPGTRGKLTPKKLGKNGDQIQRLFNTAAQVFLVQYWNVIDESVLEQMEAFAVARSVTTGQRIYYGLIDGSDSARIIEAHPTAFPSVAVNT